MDRKYVIAIAVCVTVIVVIIVIVVVVVALLIRRRRRVVSNCRRKSNDEDNPPGTTDGPGSTMEDAEKKDVDEESDDECVLRYALGYDDRDEEVSLPLTVHQTPCQVLGKGRQRPRPQSSAPFPLEDCLGYPPAFRNNFRVITDSKTDGIELGLKNSTVMLGDSATFRLRLRDNTEEAGEWTRDDVTLTHSDKTQISINGKGRQLTVTDVHPPDTGKYAYRVGEEMTSAHLSIYEADCFVSVQHPPPPPIIPI